MCDVAHSSKHTNHKIAIFLRIVNESFSFLGSFGIHTRLSHTKLIYAQYSMPDALLGEVYQHTHTKQQPLELRQFSMESRPPQQLHK